MDLDIKYIKIAIFLLKKIIGTTFPNPPVVSLIVESNSKKKFNKIVSFGYTFEGGRPHAEAVALRKVTFKKKHHYTLYSTLEPCCHSGRDESCVSRILKSKINRVVFSLRDPDKRVNGSGEKLLRISGLEVLGDILNEETKQIYDGYILNRKFSRPKVTLKIGSSIDTKIASKLNKSESITNDQVKKIVHLMRSEADAILVGKNTVNIDNPKLNCRIDGLKRFSPIRIILSKKLDLDLNSNIFKNCKTNQTFIFTIKNENQIIKKIQKKKVKVFMLDNNMFKLSYIIEELAKLGVCNLLVEGGGEVFTSFLNEDLVDRLVIFRSNYFIGGEGINATNFLNKKKKITFKPTQLSIVKNNTMEILEK